MHESETAHAVPKGPIQTNRLAILASTSALSFADVFWETTECDKEIAKMLLNLFYRLEEQKKYEVMFEILRILHSAVRVRFGPKLLALQNAPAARAYFLDCFFQSFYEIIDDYVSRVG